MKAVLVHEFTPFEQAKVGNAPDPVPGPDEVVVDLIAAEANFPDFMIIEGTYQLKPAFPFSPGKGGAGHVSAIGSKVRDLKVGDAVLVLVEFGAYAEKVKAPAAWCVPMPAGIPYDKAAAMGLAYQTAWFALKERAHLSVGDIVLVLGAAGGVGVASVQLAKALGAKMVIATVLSQADVDVARIAGADHVVVAGDANFNDALKEEVGRVTDGHGADIVIDPVGGAGTMAALRATAWDGRLVVIGFASGEIPAIKANYLLLKNISVVGLNWSDYRARYPLQMAAAQREMFALYQTGKMDPHVSHIIPLERFHDALRLLRAGQAHGKIIIDVCGKLAYSNAATS